MSEIQTTETTCSCCAPAAEQANEITTKPACPTCAQPGKKIDSATVKAMVSVSLRQVREVQHFFCGSSECSTVYYSADGTQTFTTSDVRERVYQKEPQSDDVSVCYCFGHTRASIRQEIRDTGKTTAIDDINAGIQAGQCACDWRNPQGSCCLGNVRTLVKELAD